MELSQVKTLWFKLGFGATGFVFVALNLLNYIKNLHELNERQSHGIRFSGEGDAWGFPLKMYIPYYGFDLLPMIINVLLAAFCAGAVGIAFELIAGKLIDHSD